MGRLESRPSDCGRHHPRATAQGLDPKGLLDRQCQHGRPGPTLRARQFDPKRRTWAATAGLAIAPGSTTSWTNHPPFDPDAYLVMTDHDDSYVGLVRMWRNPNGPRLGLIGTLPSHRRAPFAAALLRQCLEAAVRWGYPTFATGAALSNRVTHRALVRLGASSRGLSHQLVLER